MGQENHSDEALECRRFRCLSILGRPQVNISVLESVLYNCGCFYLAVMRKPAHTIIQYHEPNIRLRRVL